MARRKRKPFERLLRRAISPTSLKKRGYTSAIRYRLNKVAISAINNGHDEDAFRALVAAEWSKVGKQLNQLADGTPRPPHEVEDALAAVWVSATKFVAENPTRAVSAADAAARARIARDVAADADNGLPDRARAVLAHIADLAEARTTRRPAVPINATARAVGLSNRQVGHALRELVDARLIRLDVKGVPRGRSAEQWTAKGGTGDGLLAGDPGTATLYTLLPDVADPLDHHGDTSRPARRYIPLESADHPAPIDTSRPAESEETDVPSTLNLNLTLTDEERDELAQHLAAFRAAKARAASLTDRRLRAVDGDGR